MTGLYYPEDTQKDGRTVELRSTAYANHYTTRWTEHPLFFLFSFSFSSICFFLNNNRSINLAGLMELGLDNKRQRKENIKKQKQKKSSKAGNRTRVSCVTGRNTNHYKNLVLILTTVLPRKSYNQKDGGNDHNRLTTTPKGSTPSFCL